MARSIHRPKTKMRVKEGEDELDTMAPLTKWEQHGAYDNARTCENYRLGFIKALEKGNQERLDRAAKSWIQQSGPDVKSPLETKEGEEYARWSFAAMQARASRCVSISDPRLRK